MIVPTTTAPACDSPRSRASSGREGVFAALWFTYLRVDGARDSNRSASHESTARAHVGMPEIHHTVAAKAANSNNHEALPRQPPMETSHMTAASGLDHRAKTMLPRILCAALTVIAGAAVAAPASKPQHIFMEAVSSPDGRNVVSVEGDASPSGGSPVQRDLVIRSVDGKTTSVIELPCGRVAQCWPAALAWTRDSRKISFA